MISQEWVFARETYKGVVSIKKLIEFLSNHDHGFLQLFSTINVRKFAFDDASKESSNGRKEFKEGRDSRFYPVARISCSQAGRYRQPVPSYSCFLPRNGGPTCDRDGVDVCSACCAHRKCSSTSAHPSVPTALPPSSISLILNLLLLIDLQQLKIVKS